jgi:hypothetical protein
MRQYLLRCDITSGRMDKKGKPVIYGKKGDKVTEISDHDTVLIVEGKDGERFPAEKQHLIAV